MKRYELIVFDWDGTLMDSAAMIVDSVQAAARDLGLEPPSDERARHIIGLGLGDALRHVAPGLPESRYPELGARYRHHYFSRQHELSLFAGTLEMLQALKQRHHWLGVATGKGRRGLDDALAHAQLKGVFDATRTADETASKPNPLMLMELMREFGVEPERTLMIGDTTHDLLLARNAGAPGVGVAFGAHQHESFAEYAPLHVAHSTRDLHDWLVAHA